MRFVPFAVALALPLALAGAAQQATDGGLSRVPPMTGVEEPAAPFEAASWSARLSAPDLGAREVAFDELVELAARDEDAARWLRERAASESDELAWTCRLAQRELGARRIPRSRGRSPALQELERRMLELEQRFVPDSARYFLHAPLSGLTSEQTPDGAKVTVTETVDGAEQTRTYEGESLEQILAQNPELADKIQIGTLGTLGTDFEHYFFDAPGLHGLLGHGLDGLPGGLGGPVQRTDVLGVYVRELPGAERERRALGEQPLLVVELVQPRTIAHALGLMPGDVLLEVNGVAVRSREDISLALGKTAAGGEVSVVWQDAAGRRRTRTWAPESGAQDGTREL